MENAVLASNAVLYWGIPAGMVWFIHTELYPSTFSSYIFTVYLVPVNVVTSPMVEVIPLPLDEVKVIDAV